MTRKALRLLAASLAIAPGTAYAAAAAHAAPAAHAAAALDVLPLPGTPDASPLTQIDFPALSPSQLTRVVVTGSRSGEHPGSLERGHGAVFLPSHPFPDGDRVTVRALLTSPAAGAATGAPGATRITWSFSVAAAVRARAASAASPAGPAAGRLRIVHQAINPSSFTRSFHSAPALHPPVVVTGGKDPDLGSGDIFTDAQRSIQAGPLILDPQGRPVWFYPLTGGNAATDLAVQQYGGQSVLTFWQGQIANGVGQGDDVIMNHSYQTIATVHAANGYQTDLHEFQITPQGNALVTIFAPVHADLRSVGGSRNGTLLDSIIEEINIATGRLVWEWHAYGHVHLAETYAGKPGSGPYDFFHINSIQQLPSGNLIVSARHTFAVYDIVPSTGRIKWILGGRHSSFRVGRGTNFEWQHDARLYGWRMTLFYDAWGYRKSESQSRGMVIWLHPKSMTATLTNQYTHTPPVLSQSEGDLQLLGGSNAFVGFGQTPYFSEFSRSGRQLFTGRFVYPVEFYRAYRYPWSGSPPGPPAIAASATSSGTTVYASWNGATQVATWKVLAGPSPSRLAVVAQRQFNGYETGISTTSTQAYFAVQALDAAGHVLGRSAAVPR
jgi:hypothetical protein